MCCLYYAPDSGDESFRLQERLAHAIGACPVERLSASETLAARLRGESWSVRLVVLLFSTEQDLDQLMPHAALLRGIKVLVALPAGLAGFAGRVSELRPRFVDTGSTGWWELVAVAGRIAGPSSTSRTDERPPRAKFTAI